MSEVFEGYERQYCEVSASLFRKCTTASALDGEKKKQKLSEIQSGVEEAESLVNIEPISLGSLTCIIMRSTILVLTYILR
jgi:vesicle transport through interaction with t-SNAREs protein 1